MPLSDADELELEKLRRENAALKARSTAPTGTSQEEEELSDVDRYDRAYPPGSELRRLEDVKAAFPADAVVERPEGATNAFASS